MKSRLLCFALVALSLLALVACGEVPTPAGLGSDPYPPPTQGGAPPPPPDRTLAREEPRPAVDISKPIYADVCTPAPGDAERAAVAALGLSGKISFDLQRAIYLAQQQGIPWRSAGIGISYDPLILTITATVGLAEQYGVRVTHRFAEYRHIGGEASLTVIAQLAAEPGITKIELAGVMHNSRCPTPGGPTPIPITPRGWTGP